MITKMFEVFDRQTHLAIMATKLHSTNIKEKWLLKQEGFWGEPLIMVSVFYGENIISECMDLHWTRARTIRNAHHYINEHFDELESGDVIDVRFILGEQNEPEKSLFSNEFLEFINEQQF